MAHALLPHKHPLAVNIVSCAARQGVPKCELHVHIEGTFEPELLFAIAKRHGVQPKRFGSVEEAVAARSNYSHLQDFLDQYYEACSVLLTQHDFYLLMDAYLAKAAANNVRYAEVFFDPQTHTARGLALSDVVNGLYQAAQDGVKKHGVRAQVCMCWQW